MSWTRPALATAFVSLAFLSACPSDDTTDSGADSDAMTTSPTTATPTSADATADATAADATAESGNDDSSVELGCAAGAVGETTDGASDPVMLTWGASCTTDQECIDLIGDPLAICDTEAVIYEMPGGYCTKPCTLPDLETQAVPNAMDCDPNGGVTCIGSMGTFERCGIECTDDAQCNRDGYICRQLPLIAMPTDPRLCLMPDCCQDTCAEG